MTTTHFNFDEVIERRGTDSNKWQKNGPNVIPMWVADMDFPSPPAVVEALQARVRRLVEEAVQTFEGETQIKPDACFDHVFAVPHRELEEQRATFLARLPADEAQDG